MSWTVRMLIGITIAVLAVVFPWWIWVPATLIATVAFNPYWEGVALVLFFDLLYGSSLPDTALLVVGNLKVQGWMMYLVLFGLVLVLLPKQTRRHVY